MRGMALCFLPQRLCFLRHADTRRIRPRSELHFVEVGRAQIFKIGPGSGAQEVMGVSLQLFGQFEAGWVAI